MRAGLGCVVWLLLGLPENYDEHVCKRLLTPLKCITSIAWNGTLPWHLQLAPGRPD